MRLGPHPGAQEGVERLGVAITDTVYVHVRVVAVFGIGFLLLLVWLYRLTLGALFPTTCKYHPSCSQYAIDAVRSKGLFRGSSVLISGTAGTVLLAMARPIIHHRAAEYDTLFREVREGLKRLVQTQQDVLVPACTGTGAMEAAATNTLSAGDRVIVVNAGAFAQRWLAICKAYGLTVIELAAPHGETVAPDRIAQALRDDEGN